MSRDAFSYDPQDTRDATPRRATQQRPAPRAEARNSSDDASEIAGRPEAAEPREQRSGSDERSDTSRAYYVRDRAYLLRNSEIHSLTEIGRFRVIATHDLAEHEYRGDTERMEKDIRHLRKHGLVTNRTVEI